MESPAPRGSGFLVLRRRVASASTRELRHCHAPFVIASPCQRARQSETMRVTWPPGSPRRPAASSRRRLSPVIAAHHPSSPSRIHRPRHCERAGRGNPRRCGLPGRPDRHVGLRPPREDDLSPVIAAHQPLRHCRAPTPSSLRAHAVRAAIRDDEGYLAARIATSACGLLAKTTVGRHCREGGNPW